MNFQLAIVVIVVSVSLFYIARRLRTNWRRTRSGGCNSCPISKFRPPF